MSLGDDDSDKLKARISELETQLTRSRAAYDEQHAMLIRTSDKIMRDAEEVVRILTELEEREGIMARDLQYALRFQRAILPKKVTFASASFEVIYLPAEIVSGDIYDIISLDDGRLRVFLADATGHGVAAALTTMFIKSQYDLLKLAGGSPAEVLAAVNDTMTAYGYEDMRFTAVCADYHPRYGHVAYATAAHPRPLLLKKNNAASTAYVASFGDSGGPYLGLEQGLTFPEHSVELATGERLYLMTDGLTEAAGPDGESFGEERACQCAEGAAGEGADLATRLMPALSSYVGEGNPLTDDVTVIGIRPT